MQPSVVDFSQVRQKEYKLALLIAHHGSESSEKFVVAQAANRINPCCGALRGRSGRWRRTANSE